MKNIKSVLFLGFFLSTLVGCGESADSRYDSGYSDGYAVGYNTTCKHGGNLIEGDWDDKDYSRGYSDGRDSGAADCRAKSKD